MNEIAIQRLNSCKMKSFTFVKQLLRQKIPVPPYSRLQEYYPSS